MSSNFEKKSQVLSKLSSKSVVLMYLVFEQTRPLCLNLPNQSIQKPIAKLIPSLLDRAIPAICESRIFRNF
jgi:hypothetical protein